MFMYSNRPLSVKEAQKEFENEILGHKISKSFMYQLIKEDCGLKYGVPKRQLKGKNSDNNKSYRIHVIRTISSRMLDDHLFVSIDETGFSDYINKIKIWYDPSDNFKMKLQQKSQTVTFSLLLAATQNQIVGYFVVQGAVNSIVYLI